MKKSIIVLLIAVLVAGFAFAGKLTGNATIKFDTDLKAKTWGFANTQTWKYTFGFEYDTTKVEVKGETDAWAELAITGTAKLDAAPTANNTGASNVAFTANWSKYTVNLSKATLNFKFKNEKVLVVDILKAGTAADFAKTYYKVGNAQKSYVAPINPGLAGFNVTYDGYTAGLGAKGSWTDEDFFYNVFLYAKTKTFDFAEKKVTLQAGAWTVLSNDTTNNATWANYKWFGAGFSAHYGIKADKKAGIEADKIQANLAADVAYDTKNEKFAFEIAADATYELAASETIRLDVFFAPGQLVPYAAPNADAFLLAAKVTYSGHKFTFNEKMDLTVSGSVDARDILIDDREVTAEAKEVLNYKLDDKNSLKFTLTETYAILKAKTLAIVARVDYTAEKFTAWAQVSPSFQFADNTKDALTKLAFEAGIKSTKIVDKAELGLTYTRADFIKVNEKIKDAGLISAYAKIAF